MRHVVQPMETVSGQQMALGFEAEASQPPLNTAAMLAELERWGELGWLRRLDVAMARWLADEAEVQASPMLLLATALLAQRESRGHTCVELPALLAQRDAATEWVHAEESWLDGPLAAREALAEALHALPDEVEVWHAALLRSGAVDAEDDAVVGRAPLVLSPEGRLYLRRHWRDERTVARAVLSRVLPWERGSAQATGHETTPPAAQVRRWLDQLFGPPSPPTPTEPGPDWQRMACALAVRGRLALITGGPGTGKTYTVARLLALLFALSEHPEGLRIALSAPTGKAAARLKQSIDQAITALEAALPQALDWSLLRKRLNTSLTLHRLLGARPDTRALRHDARHPLDVDVLVVDEASMVHLEMMASLLEALPSTARLVLLGDKDQLASVEAGAVLGDLCAQADQGLYDRTTQAWLQDCTGQRVPAAMGWPKSATVPAPALAQQTVMLRQSRRFDGVIGELALAVNAGDARAAQAAFAKAEPAVARWTHTDPAGVIRLALHGRAGAHAGGYAAFMAALRASPGAHGAHVQSEQHEQWVLSVLRAFERFRVLCVLREGEWGVSGLNARIEAELRARRLIARSGEWYAGRPVMVTRNDPALSVYNGDIGVALPGLDGTGLRVWFAEGDQLRSVLASRLAALETAYAMTVHKSQGSEFEHVALVLPPHDSPVLTRELVYTGITRARQAFTLAAPDEVVWRRALQRRIRRVSGLPTRLRSPDQGA